MLHKSRILLEVLIEAFTAGLGVIGSGVLGGVSSLQR